MTKNLFYITAFYFLLTVLCCSAGRAQELEPLITDRPDFTESTETVSPEHTQIEGGVTLSRTGDEHNQSFGEILLRRGLGPKTELRLEIPTYAINRASGSRNSQFEDGSIGFKRVLSKGGEGFGFHKPRISFIGSASLPTGSKENRGSGFQPETKLLLGVDLSEKVALSSNVNAAYLKDEDGRYAEFSASTSLGLALSERTGAFFEVFGFLPTGGRDASKYFNTGLTYLLSNDFQVDARLGVGLNNNVDGPDHFIGLGLARRF